MDYRTAIELAHQRMREIGKARELYHIEPVTIVGSQLERNNGEILIKAYNAYYYLVNYERYSGFYIVSDASFFDADEYTENTRQEFTGTIRIIRKGASWNNVTPITPVIDPDGNAGPPPIIFTEPTGMNQTIRPIDFLRVTY